MKKGIRKNKLSDGGYVGFLIILYICILKELVWRRLIYFGIHLLLYIYFANLIYLCTKQPSMFHKNDLNRFTYDDDVETDIDDFNHNNDNNPVGSIIKDIQKQRAKKTATLPKNNISDPMGVMIHNLIKLTGVNAIPAKRIILLLSKKSKYDPKILSNMSELLQTNRMEIIALMFEATLDCYQRDAKSKEQKQLYTHLLEKVFKNISYDIIRSTLKVEIKSIAQEFHSTFCDVDLNPYKADEVIGDKLKLLKQQLQFQINDKCQFDILSPCLRHNLSPPCKFKNCNWPHVCRCGASDHIMTDKHCPKYHMDDNKFFEKIKSMNIYHSKKAKEANRWKKWRRTNPLYPGNNQPTNNKNDNSDNRYIRPKR